MPINGVRQILGLSHAVADAGIPVSSIPVISGDGGPVTDFSIIWGGDDLPPLDGAIGLQGFPYAGAGAIATGTDSNGSIGVSKSFTIGADDTHWNTTSGAVVLADGFWNSLIRVFISDVTGTRRIRIDFLALDINDPADFSGGSPPTPPSNLDSDDPSWDEAEQEGEVELSWDLNGVDESGTVIVRDGVAVGTVPAGVNTFRDTVFSQDDFVYEVRTYSYGPGYVNNNLSTASASIIVSFTAVLPDISITGSGGIDFGGSADLIFIADPSGIYTLVPGKTHDTLYERLPAVTSVDVAIPNPFAELGFLPEK